MSYLVDTDWIIDGIAGIGNARTILERLSPNGLAVSIITLGELYEGAYASDNLKTGSQPSSSFSTASSS